MNNGPFGSLKYKRVKRWVREKVWKGIKYYIISLLYKIYGCGECSVRGEKRPLAKD